MRACCVHSRYVIVTCTFFIAALIASRLRLRKRELQVCKLIPKISDIETSGEETKVRLRWHEQWQAHNSSKEAEEEVNVPTRTSRVQQVRAAINGHHHHHQQPTTHVTTSIRDTRNAPPAPLRYPMPFAFLGNSSLRHLSSSLITLTSATMVEELGLEMGTVYGDHLCIVLRLLKQGRR